MVAIVTPVERHDVIALQEPTGNRQTGGICCPGSAGFCPVFLSKTEGSRAALLVSKLIPCGDWTSRLWAADAVSVDILETLNTRVICVSVPQDPVGRISSLAAAREATTADLEGEIVLADDFNLHHAR